MKIRMDEFTFCVECGNGKGEKMIEFSERHADIDCEPESVCVCVGCLGVATALIQESAVSDKTETLSSEWTYGATAIIIGNTRGHRFEMGEKIELIESIENCDSWLCKNESGETWCVAPHEAELIT